MTAAEIAGAQAGMTAAYAAYGYNFTGTGDQRLFVDSPLLFSCWTLSNTELCLKRSWRGLRSQEVGGGGTARKATLLPPE